MSHRKVQPKLVFVRSFQGRSAVQGYVQLLEPADGSAHVKYPALKKPRFAFDFCVWNVNAGAWVYIASSNASDPRACQGFRALMAGAIDNKLPFVVVHVQSGLLRYELGADGLLTNHGEILLDVETGITTGNVASTYPVVVN